MVHRIQNRNPGYSETLNRAGHQSFNFTSNQASTLTEGANALKLDNEVQEPVINETVHTNMNIEEDNSTK